VAVPEDMRDVYKWARVRIGLDKFAGLKISFKKAVAMAKSGEARKWPAFHNIAKALVPLINGR